MAEGSNYGRLVSCGSLGACLLSSADVTAWLAAIDKWKAL